MGGSPSTPNYTPYTQVGAQQQQYNTQSGLQSQAGSMVNQYNPYGSLGYSQTGTDQYGNPTYSATQTYNSATQGLLDQARLSAGTMGSAVPSATQSALQAYGQSAPNYGLAANSANQSNALINAGMGEIASGNYGSPNNVINQTAGITNQVMGNELNAMSPFFNMQTNQLNTQLENAGIMPTAYGGNSATGYNNAYNNAMSQNSFNQGQTMSSLAASTLPQAYQIANTQYQLPATVGESLINSGNATGQLGQGYTSTGYGANAAGLQGMTGAGTGLSALQSMTPQISSTLASTPNLQISPADLTGAYSSYNQALTGQYQAAMSGRNATDAAGGQMLSSAAMMALMLM
jgi:hypothetical protein